MAKILAANIVADNYQLRGTELKNQLIETDVAVYASWKLAVNKKLRIEAVIYPSKIDQISYAFSQLTPPIFQQLDAWIQANSEEFTMDEFYNEIEHYIGISMLASKAKQELNTIIMQSAETVNKYYH